MKHFYWFFNGKRLTLVNPLFCLDVYIGAKSDLYNTLRWGFDWQFWCTEIGEGWLDYKWGYSVTFREVSMLDLVRKAHLQSAYKSGFLD